MPPKHKSLDFNRSFVKMLDRMGIDEMSKEISFKSESDKKQIARRQSRWLFERYLDKLEDPSSRPSFSGFWNPGPEDNPKHPSDMFAGGVKEPTADFPDGRYSEVWLDNVDDLQKNARGFHDTGRDRIYMSRPPQPFHFGDDKVTYKNEDYREKKLQWDKTRWHEKSHASRKEVEGADIEKTVEQTGDEEEVPYVPWIKRNEETFADYGALEILQKNLERAGMKYTPQTGRRYLNSRRNKEVIENPGSLMFNDRLDYLPVAQPNKEQTMFNTDWRDVSKSNVTTTTDYPEYVDYRQKMDIKNIISGRKPDYKKGAYDYYRGRHKTATVPFAEYASKLIPQI